MGKCQDTHGYWGRGPTRGEVTSGGDEETTETREWARDGVPGHARAWKGRTKEHTGRPARRLRIGGDKMLRGTRMGLGKERG